jgi:hypothetical protein
MVMTPINEAEEKHLDEWLKDVVVGKSKVPCG